MNLIFKKLILFIILSSIIFSVFFVVTKITKRSTSSLVTKNEAGKYLIELHEDGFHPQELNIKLNDVVKFTSTTGRPFWPASDFHPTHTIYSEFDPKNPISPDKSWSFKFERVGKWRLHDHLAPYYTGTINVIDGGRVEKLNCIDFSKDGNGSMRNRCWNEALVEALDSGGVKGAMKKVQELYITDPAFISNGCHTWAHVVGDMAFDKDGYKDNNVESWDFPIETTYCGYGFFHGLFEHFFRTHPDVKLAQRICNRLTDTFSKEIPRIRQTCFHGVGHGFMPEPPPVKIWSDPYAMMTTALEACRTISPTNDIMENRECMEGSFNVMANWMDAKEYGLKMDEKEPLEFCNKQKDKETVTACFYEYAMRLTSLAKDDIVKIATEYIKPSYDEVLSEMIIDSAAASLVERYLSLTNYDFLVERCLKIPTNLKHACLSGMSGGFIAHGEPGKEYTKAIVVCNSKVLSEIDKDWCFSNLTSKFPNNYTKEKITQTICPIIPSRFQHYCK